MKQKSWQLSPAGLSTYWSLLRSPEQLKWRWRGRGRPGSGALRRRGWLLWFEQLRRDWELGRYSRSPAPARPPQPPPAPGCVRPGSRARAGPPGAPTACAAPSPPASLWPLAPAPSPPTVLWGAIALLPLPAAPPRIQRQLRPSPPHPQGWEKGAGTKEFREGMPDRV